MISKHNFHKGNIKELRKAYPLIEFTPLGDYGVNCMLPGRTISAYWKKGKYGDSKTQQWKLFVGVNGLINIINNLLNPEPEPVIEIAPVEVNTGTQACIEHIKAKLARFLINHPNDNKTAVMLQSIIDELPQYL